MPKIITKSVFSEDEDSQHDGSHNKSQDEENSKEISYQSEVEESASETESDGEIKKPNALEIAEESHSEENSHNESGTSDEEIPVQEPEKKQAVKPKPLFKKITKLPSKADEPEPLKVTKVAAKQKAAPKKIVEQQSDSEDDIDRSDVAMEKTSKTTVNAKKIAKHPKSQQSLLKDPAKPINGIRKIKFDVSEKIMEAIKEESSDDGTKYASLVAIKKFLKGKYDFTDMETFKVVLRELLDLNKVYNMTGRGCQGSFLLATMIKKKEMLVEKNIGKPVAKSSPKLNKNNSKENIAAKKTKTKAAKPVKTTGRRSVLSSLIGKQDNNTIRKSTAGVKTRSRK